MKTAPIVFIMGAKYFPPAPPLYFYGKRNRKNPLAFFIAKTQTALDYPIKHYCPDGKEEFL